MNEPPKKPPLYEMNPPFQGMENSKIKVSDSGGSAIGDIVCYKSSGKFGVRIDFLQPPVYDFPHKAPILGEWTTIGQVPIVSMALSEAQIRSIVKCNEVHFSFALQID